MFKLQLSASHLCTCELHNQTSVHVLQNCSLYDQLRKYYWPCCHRSTPNCMELENSFKLRVTSSWGLVLLCNFQYVIARRIIIIKTMFNFILNRKRGNTDLKASAFVFYVIVFINVKNFMVYVYVL